MTLFNVSNVFVSSSVPKKDQGLGQGIFNTVVQIGTAISLALAATVAHAGGVTVDATREELLRGYRHCFWFSVGILGLPLIGVWFLKGSRASESSNEEKNEGKKTESEEEKVQVKENESEESVGNSN
jgi:MFS family permease